MDWQTSEDTVPSDFVTEVNRRSLLGKPPASGAWREGDPIGNRQFASIGQIYLESGTSLPGVRIAFETWGSLNPDASNAVLIAHALTGDSHIIGKSGPGHATEGWWQDIVGPGLAIDTDRYFVVVPNMLGGCQGTTGPASLAPDNREWASRFPFITVRDQVAVQLALGDILGIDRWAAVIGGSMGGMQAIEWAAGHPERFDRLAVIAAPAVCSADQMALNSVQIEAIRIDPNFQAGFYYDAPLGEGPHRGLALARRMALLNYRSPTELNDRFQRSWQSDVSPLGHGGVYAVESYLDFHGNKFTRRFDANSYITLVNAMNSHDIGRGRGGVAKALEKADGPALVIGIPSDRLFPIDDQRLIARHLPGNLDGDEVAELDSPFGHDSFLIESEFVSQQLRRLLEH